MQIAPRPRGNKGVKKKKKHTEISTELDLVERKITLKDILRLITSHNMERKVRRGERESRTCSAFSNSAEEIC